MNMALPETPATKTQAERLLDYLIEHPAGANPLQAWQELGIYRIADPAHRLRAKGYDVRTATMTVFNRFHEECRVGLYYLPAEEIERIRAERAKAGTQ